MFFSPDRAYLNAFLDGTRQSVETKIWGRGDLTGQWCPTFFFYFLRLSNDDVDKLCLKKKHTNKHYYRYVVDFVSTTR